MYKIELESTGFRGYWNWKIIENGRCLAASSAQGRERAQREAELHLANTTMCLLCGCPASKCASSLHRMAEAHQVVIHESSR